MAKRYNNSKLPSRALKLPKLDVSIGKRSSVNTKSTQKATVDQQNQFRNFLDDEDDEDLIMVSQMVENKNKYEITSIENDNANESVLTLDFQLGKASSSSTQVTKKSDLFGSSEDCDFLLNDNDFIEMLEANNVFKEPNIPVPGPSSRKLRIPSTDQKNENNVPEELFEDFNCSQITTVTTSSRVENVQKDAIKLNKLIEQINNLTKKTEQQEKEIQELNEKLTIKNGEVSMLRFEQRQLKQENGTLRIQKINETDQVRKDLQDRINEMEKSFSFKEGELHLKNSEVNRLRSALKNGQIDELIKTNFKDTSISKLNVRQYFHHKKPIKDENDILVKDILERENRSLNFTETFFQKELDSLSNVLLRIPLNLSELDKQLIEIAMTSFLKTLRHTEKYCKSLKQLWHNNLTKSVQFDITDLKIPLVDNKLAKVTQITPLHKNEKLIPLRRYIVAFALICTKLPRIKRYLDVEFQKVDGPHIVLQHTVDLLQNAKDSSSFKGVVESIIFLLSIFATIGCIEPCINILRSLIFYRPNIRLMCELSKCLLNSSIKHNGSILNSLCNNSSNSQFHSKDCIRVCRDTSCILKIYGTNLELTFPQYHSLNESMWISLKSMLFNHMEFLYNCFRFFPQFLFNDKSCLCYIKMSTSFLILFYLLLAHLIQHPKLMDDFEMRKNCKIGAILIINIFDTHYQNKILRHGGTSVKQRLYMICEWLVEYSTSIGLISVYQTAIERIRLSSIFADTILNDNDEETKPINSHNSDKVLKDIFTKENFF